MFYFNVHKMYSKSQISSICKRLIDLSYSKKEKMFVYRAYRVKFYRKKKLIIL